MGIVRRALVVVELVCFARGMRGAAAAGDVVACRQTVTGEIAHVGLTRQMTVGFAVAEGERLLVRTRPATGSLDVSWRNSLAGYLRRFASRARKGLPTETRDAFLVMPRALRTDLELLVRAVECPRDGLVP